MRRAAAKLVVGMAITAIGMFGADCSLGTWKLNPAKSKSASTNLIQSRTEIWEAMPDNGVKITRTEQRADGTTVNFSYAYKYDGKEYPATGGQFDTISAKRIDANTTATETKKADGRYHQTSRYVCSEDGKTRTLTAEGTDGKGKPTASTYVFEK